MNDSQPSKSARKREAQRLRALGLELTRLNARQLREVPLTDELTHAIAEHHRISSNVAKRRSLQFIGKLMRETDTEAIEQAVLLARGNSARARYRLHQLEAWRDRLIDDDAALTEYLRHFPSTDRQRLRWHIAKVRQAEGPEQQKHASRELFRFLRDDSGAHAD